MGKYCLKAALRGIKPQLAIAAVLIVAVLAITLFSSMIKNTEAAINTVCRDIPVYCTIKASGSNENLFLQHNREDFGNVKTDYESLKASGFIETEYLELKCPGIIAAPQINVTYEIYNGNYLESEDSSVLAASSIAKHPAVAANAVEITLFDGYTLEDFNQKPLCLVSESYFNGNGLKSGDNITLAFMLLRIKDLQNPTGANFILAGTFKPADSAQGHGFRGNICAITGITPFFDSMEAFRGESELLEPHQYTGYSTVSLTLQNKRDLSPFKALCKQMFSESSINYDIDDLKLNDTKAPLESRLNIILRVFPFLMAACFAIVALCGVLSAKMHVQSIKAMLFLGLGKSKIIVFFILSQLGAPVICLAFCFITFAVLGNIFLPALIITPLIYILSFVIMTAILLQNPRIEE